MATVEKQGYFPRWTLKTEGIIAPDQRLPWGQTIFVGLQHVLAMFGATVLAPIIMGVDPNTAIFFSGIRSLICFLSVGFCCRLCARAIAPSAYSGWWHRRLSHLPDFCQWA